MTIWAFNKVEEEAERKLVYQSIKTGKSRFGWSQSDARTWGTSIEILIDN